ncbi:MAG: hypothetical protein IT423_03055 [Pirellulaceae bacterium]|nr:hypothetical protein [Pirellulaceae bacterium]
MSWLVSILVALISGVAGLFLAGFIANACVSWYQISSREGASGYFVIAVAMTGGIAGMFLGLITARMIAWSYRPGFGPELIGSLSMLLLVAGVAAWLCRALADVAPTRDGCELNLEVEFRFANTYAPEQPPTAVGDWEFTFASISGRTRRAHWVGEIQSVDARFEDGQWIVPTHITLATERGSRMVTLAPRTATEVMSFALPLPARPGPEYEQWSEWLPRQQAHGQPWPADKMSYRFRVVKIPLANES